MAPAELQQVTRRTYPRLREDPVRITSSASTAALYEQFLTSGRYDPGGGR